MNSDLENLETTMENLEFMINDFVSAVAMAPDEDACEILDRLSTIYRQYAICHLLLKADQTNFFGNLKRSAETKIQLITLAEKGDESIYRFKIAGHLNPFFCALASGDLVLARTLTSVSETPFCEDYEFREDHTYARFLYKLVQNDCAVDPTHETLLNEFHQDVEQTASARYTICRAFFENDDMLWRQGLLDLIVEHECVFARKGAGIISDTVEYSTDHFIFIEGLALLFLADTVGFPCENEYRYMPGIARILKSNARINPAIG